MIEFALANLPWVLLAVASSAGLTWILLRDNAQMIDQNEAVLLIKKGKGVYIDMRSSTDFASGRIAESRNIPATELKNRVGEIDRYREKPVVLVCQNGTQSRRQARQLSDMGFRQVRALRGGMGAWIEAQLPVFK
ncbi:MAG: rhodanese-like domain-containing protein [Gammaproteobacteria bacterium WSBS_2016_MAG_OTU1]